MDPHRVRFAYQKANSLTQESIFRRYLRNFLRLYGYGAYFQNGIQFVDPQRFKPIAALIFKDDADFHPDDCHIVSYSAFGKLHAWSERHGLVTIDLLQYQVWCRQLFATEFNLPSHLSGNAEPSPERVASGLLPNEENDRELWDTNQEPMFMRCVEEHGALQRDECFGFAPALGLVGFDSQYRSVEHVKRYPVPEHFAMIAQMQPVRLTRMGQGAMSIYERSARRCGLKRGSVRQCGVIFQMA